MSDRSMNEVEEFQSRARVSQLVFLESILAALLSLTIQLAGQLYEVRPSLSEGRELNEWREKNREMKAELHQLLAQLEKEYL